MSNVRMEYLDIKYFDELSPIVRNDIKSINKLLKELTGKSHRLKPDDLVRIVKQDNLRLVVARDKTKDRRQEESIVGMATIHWEMLLTKITAYIDDVVVNSLCRGQGVGERLLKELLHIAKIYRAKCIDLTSKPEREAANALYLKHGFVKLNDKTNIYRLNI
jgi:ribosomal protein S18 acetylase RimI-like enzyme